MKSRHLISQHLENISRKALEKYPSMLRGFVGHRNGIYALYRNDHLYYVGLAKNLHSRLKSHLKDKHEDDWDELSVYYTLNDVSLRELEALLIRVAGPSGNRQRTKFLKSENLTRPFNKSVREFFKEEADSLTGRIKKDPIDFEKEFEGRVPVLGGYKFRNRKLRATLKGKKYKGRILQDGRISFNGKKFTSPSLAASAITNRAMNGWMFWKIERAPGDWVKLDWLRKARKQ